MNLLSLGDQIILLRAYSGDNFNRADKTTRNNNTFEHRISDRHTQYLLQRAREQIDSNPEVRDNSSQPLTLRKNDYLHNLQALLIKHGF